MAPLPVIGMFGGRGKAEAVEPGELEAILNLSFDSKLGSFRTRVEGIADELRSARLQFMDACERFERLDEEPYTEDLYSANVGSIKSQKSLYAEALKRLAKDLVPESERAANAYEEGRGIASHTEKVAAEILKTNANFRFVVHRYPNHLGGFKRSFSLIERLTRLLRNELEKRAAEFEEYKAVSESISRFERYGRELEEANKRIGELRKGLKRKRMALWTRASMTSWRSWLKKRRNLFAPIARVQTCTTE